MKIRILLCATFLAVPMFAATCESLASLKLPSTTITAAQSIVAGAFTLPPGTPPSPPGLGPSGFFKAMPAFCRVAGTIQPSTDSHIEFEVWLPSAGWNHKLEGAGNVGFAGSINYSNSRKR